MPHKPKTKQTPVPYGFKRKNRQPVVDPHKKESVHKMYGKLATNSELLARVLEAITEWWHETNSRRAKIVYQQKLAQQGGK